MESLLLVLFSVLVLQSLDEVQNALVANSVTERERGYMHTARNPQQLC